ncbi:TraM recognition domain-containing protein (plasmid) [Agrobacterium sp. rho-13.3]|nr:TraM recognition domain-containing protein [Agrobacterium sp. rho-13.3]MCF1501539.1 hypothetical protein [Allorhizobium sp. Av2]MDX8311490.1 TraM recognition domain-containing protein [Agrobacterium sp. rho-13.3]
MAQNASFRGVSRNIEITPKNRRDDVRTLPRRISDALDTPSGVLWFFMSIAIATVTVGLYLPLAGEIAFVAALSTYFMKFQYGSRKWQTSFRVPAYLHKMTGRVYKDASTGGRKGEGLYYLGMDLETDEELWTAANDLRTHRLVVGTTGSGKTEEIMGNIFNSLVLESGAILVDGKSDPKTFASVFRVCRVLGREEDLLLINYIMGGKDFASGLDARRTNTYNPLSSGSAAMKAELMVSLLDSGSGGGNSDMWQGRAISFLEAITPPLSFLADKGLLLFNSKLLSDFYILTNIENLVWFGIFRDQNGKIVDLRNGSEDYRRIYNDLTNKYCGALQLYLNNLPGYEAPEKPHRPTKMDTATYEEFQRQFAVLERDRNKSTPEENGEKKKGGNDPSRAKVLEQHGFITMQLVRATGNLTFNYGHIYSDEIGEINYRDVLLNRRVLLVLLPALERSKASMEQLGKMAVSAIKGVLATLLDTPLEGSYRKIIEGRPSNAKIPYSIICDEYGYYVVPGFAVAPAQARSYGVSLTFGTQDLPSLSKADKAEGEATWENTNLRHLGRMTGGKESETFKKFDGAAGQAMVQVSKSMSYQRGRLDGFKISSDSSVEHVGRLDPDDLMQQADGEFHLIVGTKSEGLGGARVVRYRAFYTGDVPEPDELRLVPYVQVKTFSDSERSTIARNEAIASNVSKLSSSEFDAEIRQSALFANVESDIIAKFLSKCETEAIELSNSQIREWLDDYDREALEKRKAVASTTVKSDIIALVDRMLKEAIDSNGCKALHRSAVDALINQWESYDDESGGIKKHDKERLIAQDKTFKAHSTLLENVKEQA